ncbi:MAG: DUF5808 domain-containing protein [Propionibacteriaceae bacterium]
MTIDDYLDRVRRTLTDPAAQAGLEDLRVALEERSACIGEIAACAEMGDPKQFATQLNAEFAAEQPDEFDPPRASKLFGIPWNLSVGKDWGRRLFNPADDRIIVPHALGMGWAINLGAVAVRMGALQPDDADDQAVTSLRVSDAAVPLAALVALAVTHTNKTHRVSPTIAVALCALPTLAKAPILDRIAVQSLGYVAVGAELTRSRRSWTSGLGALIGLGCGLANFVIPLRAAVSRAARTRHHMSMNGDCRER